MAGEFDLIARYFDWPARGAGVALSVGDDAALLSVKAQQQLAISVDTLVSGVHFPVDTDPADVGHKALTVNVSDMAAMGAEARWFTLALTLPDYNCEWLSAFSQGLKQAADDYKVDLIGGDTTRGSQTITIQIMGEVSADKALRRSAAAQGDVIFVTNYLGDAAAGLAIYQQLLNVGIDQSAETKQDTVIEQQSSLNDAQKYCLSRLNRPTARIVESRVIAEYANACIDVSDGLLQDLSHILKASGVGAVINTDTIQFSDAISSLYSQAECLDFALGGGDDYELLFTVPSERSKAFQAAMSDQGLVCQSIGMINERAGKITNQHGEPLTASGFQHF